MLSDHLIQFENGGAPACMSFNDLAAVVIETNDSGPWGDDVIWHLLGRAEGSCLSIPQIAQGFAPLLERSAALARIRQQGSHCRDGFVFA